MGSRFIIQDYGREYAWCRAGVEGVELSPESWERIGLWRKVGGVVSHELKVEDSG